MTITIESEKATVKETGQVGAFSLTFKPEEIPPPPSDASARIAVLSDPQLTSSTYVINRNKENGTMLAAAAPNLDAICTLGDETNDNQAAQWANYWSTYSRVKPPFTGKLRPVHGSASHVPYTSWVTQFGAPPSGRESWSWDIAGWHILMCASDPAPAVGNAEYNWILNDLQTHAKMPTIMMWHKARFDAGTRHTTNNSPIMQPLWVLATGSKQVQLVVNGHVHQYHRYPRMNANGVKDATGPLLLVCTNAGQGPTTAYGYRAAARPIPDILGNGFNLGWIELGLYSDHFEWQTHFSPVYGQEVQNPTTGARYQGDSGSAQLR